MRRWLLSVLAVLALALAGGHAVAAPLVAPMAEPAAAACHEGDRAAQAGEADAGKAGTPDTPDCCPVGCEGKCGASFALAAPAEAPLHGQLADAAAAERPAAQPEGWSTGPERPPRG